MAFWVVQGSWTPVSELLLLIAASSFFYVAGMILNDVADVETDRIERPERPLPSGAIKRSSAASAGFALLGCGLISALIAGPVLSGSFGELENWKPVFVSVALVLCILAYDFVVKRWWIGPFVMGACRILNILLGGSTGASAENSVLGFEHSLILIAVIVGIYVSGITWLARDEAKSGPRTSLFVGAGLILFALVSIQFLPSIIALGSSSLPIRLFIFAMTVIIGFRIYRAIENRQPKFTQAAVATCLISLILIDALFILTESGNHIVPAIAVAVLVVPARLLAKITRLT